MRPECCLLAPKCCLFAPMLFHSCKYCLGRTVWQQFISMEIVQNCTKIDCSTSNKYSHKKLTLMWSLLEKSKNKSQNCHTNSGKKSPDTLVMWWSIGEHRLPSLGDVVQCRAHIISIIVLKQNMMKKSSTSALWSRNKHGCKGWELLFQKNVIGHRF